MILKSSELCPKNEFPCDNEEASFSFSGTRELLKRAREAANQKFAKSITVTTTLNSTAQSSNLVLKGSESPAWNGQIIKTKLIRPAKPRERCQKNEAKKLTTTIFMFCLNVHRYKLFRFFSNFLNGI